MRGSKLTPSSQGHYIHAYFTVSRVAPNRQRQANASRSKVPYYSPAREARSASREVCTTLFPWIGYLGSGRGNLRPTHHHSPGCNSVTRLHPELGLDNEARVLPLTHKVRTSEFG